MRQSARIYQESAKNQRVNDYNNCEVSRIECLITSYNLTISSISYLATLRCNPHPCKSLSASSISSVRSSDQMVSSSSLLVRPSVRFVWPYVHDQQLYNFRCKSSSSWAHSNKCSLPYYMAAPLTRINGLMHLYQNLLYNIGTKFIFLD